MLPVGSGTRRSTLLILPTDSFAATGMAHIVHRCREIEFKEVTRKCNNVAFLCMIIRQTLQYLPYIQFFTKLVKMISTDQQLRQSLKISYLQYIRLYCMTHELLDAMQKRMHARQVPECALHTLSARTHVPKSSQVLSFPPFPSSWVP